MLENCKCKPARRKLRFVGRNESMGLRKGGIYEAFIAKQPNGLYCRFSLVVDCPTHRNMTEEDHIEYCAEKAREEARYVLEHRVRSFDLVKEYFEPMNMTEEEFSKLLVEMGDSVER